MIKKSIRNKEEIKYMIDSLKKDIKNKEKMITELKKELHSKKEFK